MSTSRPDSYVSRGGEKLSAALDHFNIDVQNCVCADLGSHVGGFVDCLLRRGASRVYSVDTCYGTLAWVLRRDDRVVVLERTNAMHVSLPEPVDIVTIDVGWTPQAKVLPNVAVMVRAADSSGAGLVVSLIKPHYEAAYLERAGGESFGLVGGVLPDDAVDRVMQLVLGDIAASGWVVRDKLESPIRGHGGNREFLVLLARAGEAAPDMST